jgi:hypothetical protein
VGQRLRSGGVKGVPAREQFVSVVSCLYADYRRIAR